MALHLRGKLEDIRGTRLHFSYIDGASKVRLDERCPADSTSRPHSKFGFIVSLPRMYKEVPEDIKQLLNVDCALSVSVLSFEFISQKPYNKGTKLKGIRLVLKDISRVNDL